MAQVHVQGFPVFAAEVRGLPAAVATLLDSPEVRSVGLADEFGRLPSAYQLALPRSDEVD